VSGRRFEQRLRDELHAARPPGAGDAERRAWHVVEAAHAERAPAPRPRRARRFALVLAGAALLAALFLTPAGARMGDWIGDMVAPAPKPTRSLLGALPAEGRLLVHAADDAWVVQEDGRRRRLAALRDAVWSPGGLYLAAGRGRELVALEPDGDERWALPGRGRVADPRWSPDGFRIAYRSGGDLYVTVADNSARWRLARNAAAIPAAWAPGRPAGDQVLAFAAGPRVRVVDVDERRTLGTTARGAPPRELWWSGRRLIAVMKDEVRVHDARGRLLRRLALPPRLRAEGSALDPAGRRLAVAAPRADGRSSELLLYRLDGSRRPQRIFAGPGFIEGLTWSVDGRVLALGLPSADQWLFLRPRGGRLEAVSRISRQFGARPAGAFPRPAGWCHPEPVDRAPAGQPPCTPGSAP
jgi:hypothetical protein